MDANIGFIVITACDTAGNTNLGENNLAKQFAMHYENTPVIASSGTVITRMEDICSSIEYLGSEGYQELTNINGEVRDREYIGFYGLYYFDGNLNSKYLGNQDDEGNAWTICSLVRKAIQIGEEKTDDNDGVRTSGVLIKKVKELIWEKANEQTKE